MRRIRNREKGLAPLPESAACAFVPCTATFKPKRRGNKFCSAKCQTSSNEAGRRARGYDSMQFVQTKVVTAAQRRKAADSAPTMPNGIGGIPMSSAVSMGQDMFSNDASITEDFHIDRKPGATPEQILQIGVLEEAITHLRGRAFYSHRDNRLAIKSDAIEWLRGGADCNDLGPFNSVACFESAGINQAAALAALGI